MSTYANQRQLKIAALQEALKGNTEPLQQIQQQRGRLYTPDELEQRRVALGKNFHCEFTLEDSIRVLGRYDKSHIPGRLCREFGDGLYSWT